MTNPSMPCIPKPAHHFPYALRVVVDDGRYGPAFDLAVHGDDGNLGGESFELGIVQARGGIYDSIHVSFAEYVEEPPADGAKSPIMSRMDIYGATGTGRRLRLMAGKAVPPKGTVGIPAGIEPDHGRIQ